MHGDSWHSRYKRHYFSMMRGLRGLIFRMPKIIQMALSTRVILAPFLLDSRGGLKSISNYECRVLEAIEVES
jgi:hypothetical protein